jgi:hypothetical protein
VAGLSLPFFLFVSFRSFLVGKTPSDSENQEPRKELTPRIRYYFLKIWLSFACANDLVKVMWQTPATVWYDRPDNVIADFPAVELLWSFKGRKDPRAAPFFISMDFFVPIGTERPVHLLHEMLLHFDLILAWDSLDAVMAYRLSENNSR